MRNCKYCNEPITAELYSAVNKAACKACVAEKQKEYNRNYRNSEAGKQKYLERLERSKKKPAVAVKLDWYDKLIMRAIEHKPSNRAKCRKSTLIRLFGGELC